MTKIIGVIGGSEAPPDILLLAEFFLERYTKQYGKGIRRISSTATDLLMRHAWPGNVRELENCIERAIILCKDDVIQGFHLPPSLQRAEKKQGAAPSCSLEHTLQTVERELIIDALKANSGNMTKAAAMLASTERVVGLRVKKYGINPRSFRS